MDALAPFSGATCDFALESETAEQMGLWRSLKRALPNAGWAPVGWLSSEPESTPFLHGGETIFWDDDDPTSRVGIVPASNVEIHIHHAARSQLESAATALIAVLNEIGIEAADMGFNTPNANPAAIHILIGEKR